MTLLVLHVRSTRSLAQESGVLAPVVVGPALRCLLFETRKAGEQAGDDPLPDKRPNMCFGEGRIAYPSRAVQHAGAAFGPSGGLGLCCTATQPPRLRGRRLVFGVLPPGAEDTDENANEPGAAAVPLGASATKKIPDPSEAFATPTFSADWPK